MYDYNSKIKLKIENDFFRKKMSTVKERKEKLHKFKQTLSNYKRSIISKSINQKSIKRKI